MAHTLLIESSTLVCSVAVADGGRVIALREHAEAHYCHSERLTVLIGEAIAAAGLRPDGLQAVCVAKGPGSYTGLRIGVSAAKGICYALGIPLLAVDSLQALAMHALQQVSEKERAGLSAIRPLIDARRMEVYTALFGTDGQPLSAITASVVGEGSFAPELENGKVLLVGDGAGKCQDIIRHPNAIFRTGILSSAIGLAAMAHQRLGAGQVEDVAYFEPFYLKDFVPGTGSATP